MRQFAITKRSTDTTIRRALGRLGPVRFAYAPARCISTFAIRNRIR